MHVGICTDHGGFELKNALAEKLRAAGHQVTDFGAHSLNPQDDYPELKNKQTQNKWVWQVKEIQIN